MSEQIEEQIDYAALLDDPNNAAELEILSTRHVEFDQPGTKIVGRLLHWRDQTSKDGKGTYKIFEVDTGLERLTFVGGAVLDRTLARESNLDRVVSIEFLGVEPKGKKLKLFSVAAVDMKKLTRKDGKPLR